MYIDTYIYIYIKLGDQQTNISTWNTKTSWKTLADR